MVHAISEEKSRDAYRNLQRTLAEYRMAKRRVSDILNSMAAKGVKRIVLWGNTNITDLVLRLIAKDGPSMTVVGVVDSTDRHPRTIDASILPALSLDAVVICEAEAAGIPEGMTSCRLIS